MVISGNGGRKIIASKTPELENLAEDIISVSQGVENIFDHIEEVHQTLYGTGEGNGKEIHTQLKHSEDSEKESMESLYGNKVHVIHSYKDGAEKINELATRAIDES